MVSAAGKERERAQPFISRYTRAFRCAALDMGGGATKHAKEPAKDVADDEEFNPIHPDAQKADEGGNSMSEHQSVRPRRPL